jgi:hypothetical protein
LNSTVILVGLHCRCLSKEDDALRGVRGERVFSYL